MIKTLSSKKLIPLTCAFLVPASAFAVVEWKGVQFGGFASQGYLQNTGDNDYLGETSEGTFDFREYAVNASWAKGKFRLGAQVFGQKLGKYGNDDIVLDWATIDYQHSSWLGLRAGRVKTPRGLYNESLDVDSVRPFVLMPQSVYDARLRDFNASFDGVMLFGNIDLKDFGSIDYKVYGGDIPMDLDSGANDYFNNDAPFPNVSIGMDAAYGTSIFWNTPIDGLRAGYSFSVFENFRTDRAIPTGPGMPDLVLYKLTDDFYRHMISVEYYLGDWVFAAELGRADADYHIGFPNDVGNTLARYDYASVYGYVSSTYRLSDKIEFGAYYSYSKDTQDFLFGPPGGTIIPALKQHDYAISVRYDLTNNWLIKAEVHYMDGAGKLFDIPSAPQPVGQRDQSWILFAAKTTYTF